MNTLTSLLQKASQAKEKVGFIFVNRKEEEIFYHFSQVNTRSQKAASALYKLGIRKGDFVAIMLPTSIEFMDCFLGAQAIGAIPVPLYPPMRLGKLDEYFIRTGAMLKKVEAKILHAITNPKIKQGVKGTKIQSYLKLLEKPFTENAELQEKVETVLMEKALEIATV